MPTLQILTSILVVVLVLSYLRYYYKYSSTYNITQSELCDLKIDTLYERNPVVVFDPIHNPSALLETLFKYSYIFKQSNIIKSNTFTTLSKFTIVWCAADDIEFDLVNKINGEHLKSINTFYNNENAEYISFKLRRNQVLILPPFWTLILDGDHMNIIELDDIFSKVTRLW